MHPSTQRRRAFALAEIMIVVVIVGLLAAMAIPFFVQRADKDKPDYALYRTWCRAYQSSLSYDEWQLARRQGVIVIKPQLITPAP